MISCSVSFYIRFAQGGGSHQADHLKYSKLRASRRLALTGEKYVNRGSL